MAASRTMRASNDVQRPHLTAAATSLGCEKRVRPGSVLHTRQLNRSGAGPSASTATAILFPTFSVDGYHWAIFASSGLFDVKKKLRNYSQAEWDKFH
jgi:hypothetical protein